MSTLEAWYRDLAHGVRTLVARPVSGAVAILTLGIGSGATAAVFSVVDAVLLRPPIYVDSNRIVTLWSSGGGGRSWGVTGVEFFDLRDRSRTLASLAAYQAGAGNLAGAGDPEHVGAAWVSAGFFDILGVAPAVGRVFTADEDRLGRGGVVLLSHGLWQRRFAGDPGIVGRTIALDAVPRTVIGVMPRGFGFPHRDIDVWVPLALERAAANPRDRSLNTIARLATGVDREQAARELSALAADLLREYAQRYPRDANTTPGFVLVPLREILVGDVRPIVLVAFGSIGLVMLLACANVAILLLARAHIRSGEMAIRSALGASRGRLLRLMVAESSVLCTSGGILGVLLAMAVANTLGAMVPPSVLRLDDVRVDERIVLFQLPVVLATIALVGLAPAVVLSRVERFALGERTSSLGARWQAPVLRGLVVTEAALAVLLLAGAGLTARTLWVLQRVDPGFADGEVLTLRLTLPTASYRTADRVMAFAGAALDRIRAVPGVTDAGLVTRLPLTGINANLSFGIDGSGVPPGENDQNADYRIATPGYFRALGVPLLRGRPFDDRDVDGAPDVVIVNDSFARRFFPGQDAVGRRLTLGVAGTPWFTVVGIVGDVRHRGLHLPPRPEIYFARAQRSYVQVLGVWRSAAVVIRSKVAAETLAGPVRAAIGALDPDLPIARVATMEQMVAESIAAPRFTMRVLTAFAAAAVVLACLALYGVMSCLVGQRARELATRLALGAKRRTVFFLVMREGVALALAGATLGIGASLATGRALSGLLVEISPHDPVTLAGVMLVVSVVAALACYFPARRAAGLDPAVTLREGGR